MSQAEYVGKLTLGDTEFPCAVLSDGGAQVPLYLAFKNLIPYINMHLGDVHQLVLKYKTKGGSLAQGTGRKFKLDH